MSEIWTTKERHAWAWPNALTPSEWAEQNRILPAHVTAEPGPWRGARTPYLAGIIDAIQEPGAEEIVVIKAAQVGFSESLRNLLGFFIDHDPGPTLIVMPDQKSAEELIEERIKPLLEYTPAVARHLTSRAWDVKKSAIRLTTMSIYIGWAGSSQALKSRPIRNLYLEEPDEYPAVSGAGGDPISKAMKRVTTYAAKGRARVIIGGTPTRAEGNIWKAWEACGDQRHFWCPCPHCGKYQRLIWSRVKFEHAHDGESVKQHAARIIDTNAAWYECEGCSGRITEQQKLQMIRGGIWAGQDQVVTPDGRVAGPVRHHRRIGFCLPAMYSPWVSFAKLAAEWIEAQDDHQQLCDFVNQRLAEPFEDQIARVETNLIRQKASISPAPGVVPKWAQQMFATADTQKDWFKVHVRAWGWGYQSQLVYEGECRTFEELYRIALEAEFPIDGGAGKARASHLLIDTGGDRTNEVYQFAMKDPGRIVPTKGASQMMRKPWTSSVLPNGVVLRLFDTNYFKDMLARLIQDPDQAKWLPHSGVSPQYCREMCNEQKVFDRSKNRAVWKPIGAKARVESWDCEVLACLAADMANIGAMPAEPEAKSAANQPTSNPLDYRGRW